MWTCFYIHWPLPARGKFVSTWKTFIRLRDDGLARSIGVSNFKPAHLEALIHETGAVPAVNQIQMCPAIPRLKQISFNRTHGIVTQCWSPILNMVHRPVSAGHRLKVWANARAGYPPMAHSKWSGADPKVKKPEAVGRKPRRVRFRAQRR